eukprot:gene8607-17760_t
MTLRLNSLIGTWLIVLLFLPFQFSYRLNLPRVLQVSQSAVRLNSFKKSLQNLDYTTLSFVCNELSTRLIPGRIENVFQLDSYNLALQIQTSADEYQSWLHICWHPQAARISLGSPPPKSESNPYSFASTLRHMIKGYTITDIKILQNFDRIVEISLSQRLSDPPQWSLIIEIMGKRSNVILKSSSDNSIQACAYQVSSSKSIRPLQTGIQYQLPPQGNSLYSPDNIKNFDDFYRHINHNMKLSISSNLLATYRGLSPNVIRDILHFLHIDNDMIIENIDNEVLQKVYQLIIHWRDVISIGTSESPLSSSSSPSSLPLPLPLPLTGLLISPRLVGNGFSILNFQETSSTILKETSTIPTSTSTSTSPSSDIQSPTPSTSNNVLSSSIAAIESTDITFSTVSSMIDEYYGTFQRRDEFNLLYASCERRLNALQNRAQKVSFEFEGKLLEASGDRVSQLRAKADLLTSFAHTWASPSTEVRCIDFFTNEPVIITLPEGKYSSNNNNNNGGSSNGNSIGIGGDKDIGPMDYANQLYKEAKKLQRSESSLKQLVLRARQRMDQLEEVEVALMNLQNLLGYDDILALREVSDELSELERFTVVGSPLETYDKGSSSDNIMENNYDKKSNDKKANKESSKNSSKNKNLNKKIKNNNGVGGSSSDNNSNSNSKRRNGGNAPTAQLTSSKKSLQGLLVLRPQFDSSESYQSKSQRDLSELNANTDSISSSSTSSTTLVVGRNSIQNDRISFRIARESDLWFHVQGCPGSHCLLRLEKGMTADSKALQFAADVASYYSKGRGNTQVPVMYCSPRFLKKAGAPGAVKIETPSKTQPNKASKSDYNDKQYEDQDQAVGGVIYGRPDSGQKFVELWAPTS